MLKIFLTGDNHIGLKYNNYPDYIKQDLIEARVENLQKLVSKANGHDCDLFVIAGDLFDKVKIAQREIDKVVNILKGFSGTVLVMPGNHDYYDDVNDLWKHFNDVSGENTIVLNKWEPYSLKSNDIDAIIYPAYCNRKHSDVNCLGWLKELSERDEAKWHVGVAHGSLQGLSPDINNRYYNMDEKELEGIEMDLWLLGHTHVPYPQNRQVRNKKVYNAGTPEPDGLDCRHGGNSWIITIDEEKNIEANQIETGIYRFYDMDKTIESLHCLDKIKAEILAGNYQKRIVRLNLSGRVDREIFHSLQGMYNDISDKIAHFEARELKLKLKITQEEIENEYTKGSFPYEVLSSLIEDDGDALQLAYELIGGCRDEN